MASFELRQVIGKTRVDGKVRSVAWNMDMVLMDGRQIATINRVPGAPIGLLPSAIVTPSQREQLANVIAEARGGIRPASIKSPVKVEWEYADDEDTEELGVDDE